MRGGVFAATGVMLAMTIPAALAQSDTDVLSDFLACDAIEAPADRLTCFETTLKLYKIRYGLLRSDPDSLARDDQSRSSRGGLPGAVRQGDVDSGALPPVGGREGNRSVGSDDASPGVAPPRELPDEFEAQIVRTWNVGATNYVELDNGSVWRESGGNALRVTGNEQVRIYTSSFGGKRMAIGPSGRVVNVKRVQ